MSDTKKVEQIEVIKPKVVTPKKKVVKFKFLQDVGTDEKGKIRYQKGHSYELTKEQIDNYKKHKLICQH